MMPRAKDHYATGEARPDLFAMLRRPEWHAEAACRGTMHNGRNDWFPDPHLVDPNLAGARALTVCGTCPVRVECAATGQEEFGIWGFVTAREQEAPRRTEARRLARRSRRQRREADTAC